MEHRTHNVLEWLVPLAFIISAAWVIWNGPGYIMAFGWGSQLEAIAARYPAANALDWIALTTLPVFLVIGTMTVRRAPMEFADWGVFDRLSVFIGRVTMLLIVLLVSVMVYEVVLRYAFERPTLWANEMSLWMAGFIFVLAGLYAMQQRSHIRIFLLYDIMPRWLQRTCDTVSTTLIVVFAFFLVYGGFGEAQAKFLRWETFGTAFDPPIPATEKPLILLVVVLVALQSVANLIRDWNAVPEIHTAADDIDADELERLRAAVGSEGVGEQDVTRGKIQSTHPRQD